MAETKNANLEYKKIEIDNSVCGRRFHIAFETNSPSQALVKLKCPHCDVVIFEEHNHPQAILSREENLISAPDGTNKTLNTCHFNLV